MPDWYVYTGVPDATGDIGRLPPPPPWRDFKGAVPEEAAELPEIDPAHEHQARSYRPDPDAVEQVNAALYLRRPLLVTGRPGTGKSTLAHAVARELRLGPVLYWAITSRVTLADGLYSYDPLTRLYDRESGRAQDADDEIGKYVRLGPLGTALLPAVRPRVLLIDEIDKSDIDLPNDLLTIFEEGRYEIRELARQKRRTHRVSTADGRTVPVTDGSVGCKAFPLVIMTSNGEREFPAAFLRRCVTLALPEPGRDELREIVRAHLGDLSDESEDLIRLFLSRKSGGQLATDQLLHAVYLTHHAARDGGVDRLALAERIMPHLNSGVPDDDD
ncbi:AAA family ATPase [Microbispora rosea]|uniref:AAA family ATPase n=1 Tax=Microbispora rosea TaxID=58117 RepID=UPI0004C3EDF0|nr:MoxR family ATPase [Microbispora rosea]